MKELGPTSLVDTLVAWGAHECRGRLNETLVQAETLAAGADVSATVALEIVLKSRAPLIGLLLLAQPSHCVVADFEPDDLPLLHVLEHPLDGHATAMLNAANEAGDYIRRLAQDASIEGALVATKWASDDRVFIIDGHHRACAWVEQTRRGLRNTIRACLVVTAEESCWAARARETAG